MKHDALDVMMWHGQVVEKDEQVEEMHEGAWLLAQAVQPCATQQQGRGHAALGTRATVLYYLRLRFGYRIGPATMWIQKLRAVTLPGQMLYAVGPALCFSKKRM